MEIRNNVQSPNFGMALKIKPDALPILKTKGMEAIEALNKAGEGLKDTQIWHLEIIPDKRGEHVIPKIVSPYANKYLPPFEVSQKYIIQDGTLTFNASWAGGDGIAPGEKYTHYIKYASKEAAMDAYARLQGCKSQFETAVELTKELDKRALREEAEGIARRAELKRISDAVNDLYKKYGEPYKV